MKINEKPTKKQQKNNKKTTKKQQRINKTDRASILKKKKRNGRLKSHRLIWIF